MPVEAYSSLPDTVLAYKRDHHIGRFDPAAPDIQRRKVKEMWDEVQRAGMLMIYLFFFFGLNGFCSLGFFVRERGRNLDNAER